MIRPLLTFSCSKLTLVDSHPPDRATFPGAQRTIRSFISSSQHSSGFPALKTGVPAASGTSRAGPHCQRTRCFEGTKKPISRERWDLNPGSSSPIDLPSLGRPRSWRPAKLSTRSHTRQHLFRSFFDFFQTGGNERCSGNRNTMIPVVQESGVEAGLRPGSESVTHRPPPGGRAAETEPPQLSMAVLTMARPRPLPPVSRLRERSRR